MIKHCDWFVCQCYSHVRMLETTMYAPFTTLLVWLVGSITLRTCFNLQLKFRLTQTLQPLFSLFVFWLTLQMEMEKQTFARWSWIHKHFKCVVNWTVKGCSHGIANRFCYLARSVTTKNLHFNTMRSLHYSLCPSITRTIQSTARPFCAFSHAKSPHDQDPSKAVKCVVNWTVVSFLIWSVKSGGPVEPFEH